MVRGEVSSESENPLAGGPVLAPDDLTQARQEAEQRDDLERQINFAIDEINANPNIPSEIKTELVNNLRSLKTGLGVNANLAQVQKEINEARATAQHVATSNAIYDSLSAAGQAAVDARVNALSEGRFADYYFDTFDPENQLDPSTRAYVSEQIEKNTVIQDNARAYQALGPEQLTNIEAIHETNREFVKNKLEETSGQERAAWQRVADLRLMRIPGYGELLRNASPSELNQIVEQAIQERIRLAQPILDQYPGNTPIGRYLRQIGDTDGYGNPDVIRLLEVGNSPEGREALRALANAGGDPYKLPVAQRAIAAAADFAQKVNANYGYQSNILQMIRDMSHAKEGEIEHNEHLEFILNKENSRDERIATLADELAEHGDDAVKNLSLAARRDIARQFISQIDLLENPRQSIFAQSLERLSSEELNTHFEMETQRSMLRRAGFSAEQISTLEGLATEPVLRSTLTSALRVLDLQNNHYQDAQREATRQQLVNATNNATNPLYQDALSKIRYYNLTNNDEGQSALLNILSGQLDPSTAARIVDDLRQQTLLRMQPLAIHAPSMLNPDYQSLDRLTRLGMFDADGSINIDRLIETARHNRDALGDSDAAIAARASMPWSELTEEDRDKRVIAQAAIRFKAFDAVQQFGERLAEVTDQLRGNTVLSEAYLNDRALFEQLNDSRNPEAQKSALDEILKSLQYLRVNDSLRAEVTNDMAALLASGSLVFGEQRAAVTSPTSAPVVEAPDTAAPAVTGIPSTPNLDREQAFDTTIRIDSREQQGSTGLDNLSKSNLEKAILGAVQNLSPETRQQILGSLLGSYNEIDPNFISYNEIENAVRAVDKTKNSNEILSAIDSNGNGMLSLNEITTYLANAGVSGGQGVASNSTPAAQAVPSAAGPASPIPTPGR